MEARFYRDGSGKSPVKEFILALPGEAGKSIIDAVALLEQGRNLASIHPALHELRLKDRAGQIFTTSKRAMPFISCTHSGKRRGSCQQKK